MVLHFFLKTKKQITAEVHIKCHNFIFIFVQTVGKKKYKTTHKCCSYNGLFYINRLIYTKFKYIRLKLIASVEIIF